MKTLVYLSSALGAAATGAVLYKRVEQIRKGVDTAHDVALDGINKAFSAMKSLGEKGEKAVEARQQGKAQGSTIQVEQPTGGVK